MRWAAQMAVARSTPSASSCFHTALCMDIISTTPQLALPPCDPRSFDSCDPCPCCCPDCCPCPCRCEGGSGTMQMTEGPSSVEGGMKASGGVGPNWCGHAWVQQWGGQWVEASWCGQVQRVKG